MREIRTETTIAAPPERVWDVLTRFSEFPQWNSFLRIDRGAPVIASWSPEAARVAPSLISPDSGEAPASRLP